MTLWSRLAAYSCGGSCGLSPVLLERALPHSLSILLRGTAASTRLMRIEEIVVGEVEAGNRFPRDPFLMLQGFLAGASNS